MKLTLTLLLLLCVMIAGAQSNSIEQGTIKKVDMDRRTITLVSNGKEQEFLLDEETRIFGEEGKPFLERLKTLHVGASVFFKPIEKSGKTFLMGLKPTGLVPTAAPLKVDTSKLRALPELGKEKYQGFEGGLYPGGKNERPSAHERAGVALAQRVKPLDANGRPSPQGKIVLLSIGMSNTGQASDGFARQLSGDKDKNPALLFVNGAQGGMTAKAIQDPADGKTGTRYWTEVDTRLQRTGVTAAQVEAVWLKQADAGPTEGFPRYAQTLSAELESIVHVLFARFPNLKLVYLSSRTYGGYARTSLNPEPYAYESGFSVKWLIERQLTGAAGLNFDPARGAVKAPWLSWGPYLWVNGGKGSSSLPSLESDFAATDGTHESPSGQDKVGKELLRFFKTDATTAPWFLHAK